MPVELVDWMGDDLRVVNAARVSFGRKKEVFDERDERLIWYLAKHGHWSPFAHVVVTLWWKAPIFMARQLAKHQVGGVWNEISRRYVTDEPEFWKPEEWRAKAENKKQGSVRKDWKRGEAEGFELLMAESYAKAKNTYERLVGSGVAPEQARAVLPLGMMTEWYWTGSLYFWARVYKLRTEDDAQYDTMMEVVVVGELMKKVAPVSWQALMAYGKF